MSFSKILSHSREVSILKRAVLSERVAHAYLFAGIDGIGKRKAAKELARALNCTKRLDDGDSCGGCPSCSVFDNPGNLNYMEIEPEKGYLKIDKIRELQRALRFKTDTETRVIVVDSADAMGAQPANAFLKTLEEPAPGTVIILLSSRPSLLLPTIRSRCQRINFSPLPLDSVVTLLMKQGEDGALGKEEATALASLSLGSMSRAEDLLKSGIYEESDNCFKQAQALLTSLLNGTMDTQTMLKRAVELSKDERLFILLEIMKSSLRDLVVAGEGASELVINHSGIGQPGSACDSGGEAGFGFKELVGFFSAVDRGNRDMMPPRNANKQLALEAIFMELSLHSGDYVTLRQV